MSYYTKLVANALFPLHERLKRHDSVARLRSLERTQWLEPGALRELQAERLRSFLARAGSSVPYYRERFRQLGFDPAALRSVSDIRELPLLTKADIRTHAESLRSDVAGPLRKYSTGGSSGEPLVFQVGMARVSHDVAAKWRATRWWGVDIGDPETVLWGSPIELGAQDRVRLWRDRMLRSQLLPAFEMSDAKMDGFIDRIRRQRPRMLFGYPSALALVAKHAESRGVSMADLGCRVAFATGERLFDTQRALISRVFGCPVANGYGARDAGFVAHQCPAGGMHVCAEDIVVELLDGQGVPVPDGEPGEIVVTHLATEDFPFIRYRTGDIAVADPGRCSCGRGLPLLREIQGRSNDFVVAADGTVMQGAALTYVLRDLPGVEAFKIVQESLHRTRVYIVAADTFDRASTRRIEAGFKRRLGDGVEIVVDFVAHIAPEKSGKYRYIVSQVGDALTPRPLAELA